MTRRGRGEGSIVQRPDGRWMARASLDGRRKAYYGKTRAEAAQKLAAGLKAHSDGLPVPSDKQTFAEFVEKWVEAITPAVRPRTAALYALLLRRHAVPVIGKKPLTRIGPADLVHIYELRRKAGAAPRSVLHLHRAIHRALRFAERWGDVPRNVASLVDAPKVARTTMRCLTAEEARKLLDTAQGDRLEAFPILALSTGMRSGELLGLTWRAVDLERVGVHGNDPPPPSSFTDMTHPFTDMTHPASS